MKVALDVPLPTVDIECPFCGALVAKLEVSEVNKRKVHKCTHGCGKMFWANVQTVIQHGALKNFKDLLQKTPPGPGAASDPAAQSGVRTRPGGEGEPSQAQDD